jgi:hypothetical protein
MVPGLSRRELRNSQQSACRFVDRGNKNISLAQELSPVSGAANRLWTESKVRVLVLLFTELSPLDNYGAVFLRAFVQRLHLAKLPLPFTGRFPFLASPGRSRLANASWPNRVQHCFVHGLVVRFRLLSTLPLVHAVAVSYGQTSTSVR